MLQISRLYLGARLRLQHDLPGLQLLGYLGEESADCGGSTQAAPHLANLSQGVSSHSRVMGEQAGGEGSQQAGRSDSSNLVHVADQKAGD